MRMIKEMVRVLFSLAFGKEYVSVELEKENKYEDVYKRQLQQGLPLWQSLFSGVQPERETRTSS